MKKTYLFIYLSLTIFGLSCTNQKHQESGIKQKDSLSISAVQPTENAYAEDLLSMTSHEDLIKNYGKANVIKDRFVYADDPIGTPASIMFKGTDKEITIEWRDTVNYKDLQSINVSGYTKTDTSMLIYTSQWKTKTGLRLGMPLTEVKELNGKDFVIDGLGWDYGGGVITWNDGNLSKDSNISLTFADANADGQLTEKEQNQVYGEGVQVSSSNQALQKLNPIISNIFVRKKP